MINKEKVSKAIRYKKVLDNLNLKIIDGYKDKNLNINSYIRLGLLAKYDKSIKAICKLDLLGYFEDANIILRTVFETFITIMYCETNPANLYRRFFDYNTATRLKYIDADKDIKELMEIIYKDNIEKMKKKRQEFKEKYNMKNPFNWTDISVSKICKKLDKLHKTTFYSSKYIAIYMNYSYYIHPNIVNIFENYIDINSPDKGLYINCKASEDENYTDIIENIEQINEKLINLGF